MSLAAASRKRQLCRVRVDKEKPGKELQAPRAAAVCAAAAAAAAEGAPAAGVTNSNTQLEE